MELKVPPHNIETEQVILCCCIINPEYSIPVCMEQIQADDFYRGAHQIIYESLIRCRSKLTNEGSLVVIAEDLKNEDLLDKAGGQDYLMSLVDLVAGASGIQHYIDILLENSRKRKYLHLAGMISGGIELGKSEDIYSLIQEQLENINMQRSVPVVDIKTGLKQTFRELEKACENDTGITGISTGFRDIDRYTKGLQNGELIIIAGRPGHGKSLIVKDWAEASSVPVLWFPIEMSVSQTQKRQIAGQANVDFDRIQAGILSNQDWQNVVEAIDKLTEKPIYYVDKGYLTIEEVIAISHQEYRKHGIRLIIIDYMQLLHGKSEKREQEISKISRQLKGLSRDLNIPVVAVSQLNRDCEKRPTKRPMLSDLRESGAIEQDADVVCLLYRASEYFKNEEEHIAEFIIAKGRNIKTGMIKLYFDGKHQKFGDLFKGEG